MSIFFLFPEADPVLEKILNFFTSEAPCDVTLKVKNESIPSYKFVLAARSDVFTKMFEADISSIDIPGFDPEPFKEFLGYLYLGRVEKMADHALDLYRIAHEYMVEELLTLCTLYIMANLSPQNICDVAVLCAQIENVDLKEKMNAFFAKRYGEIVLTEMWMSLMEENTQLAKDLLEEVAKHQTK